MKTWLITGCSGGIGKGIAKAVLEKGDQAVITARNAAKLDDLVQAYPDTALAVSLEIKDKQSIANALEKAYARFGKIDVLINNAGHGYRSALEEGEDEGVAEVFATNFFGPVELIKQALPKMRERKSGAIVNVTSIAATRAAVGSGYYAASKASLEMVSEALYMEVAPLGIKVMMVEPGAFRTGFYDEAMCGTSNHIGDYAETAGKRHAQGLVNKHDQPGDPMKGGKLIVDTIERDDYPRRLLLGSDAVDAVTKALQTRLDEAVAWKDISAATDYGSQ